MTSAVIDQSCYSRIKCKKEPPDADVPEIESPSHEAGLIDAALEEPFGDVAVKKESNYDGEPMSCDLVSERQLKQEDIYKHRAAKYDGSKIKQCDRCDKTFIERWRLLRHLRTHSDDKRFNCKLCDKEFSESGNLTKHINQVHTKFRPFKCETCDKSFSQKKDLQGHMVVHIVKRYICLFCQQDFPQAKERRIHEKTAHSNNKHFTCGICDAVFSSKLNLYNHKIIHKERIFPCLHCQKKFHTIPRLRKHMRLHKVEEHSRCEICDKSFSQDSNLKRHIEQMHMREGRFFCIHCSQTFCVASELRTHRNTQHLNERPFKCSVCEKAFFRAQSLGNHYRCHKDPDRHVKEFIKPIKRSSHEDPQELNPTSPNSPKRTHSSMVKPRQVSKKALSKKILIDAKAKTNAPKISRQNPEGITDTNKTELLENLNSCQRNDAAKQSDSREPTTVVIKEEKEDWIDIGPTEILER